MSCFFSLMYRSKFTNLQEQTPYFPVQIQDLYLFFLKLLTNKTEQFLLPICRAADNSWR